MRMDYHLSRICLPILLAGMMFLPIVSTRADQPASNDSPQEGTIILKAYHEADEAADLQVDPWYDGEVLPFEMILNLPIFEELRGERTAFDDPVLAMVADTANTFKLQVKTGPMVGNFRAPLSSFTYDPATYTYRLQVSSFQIKSRVNAIPANITNRYTPVLLGTLRNLDVQIKLVPPYRLRYSYQIDLADFAAHDQSLVEVDLTALDIEPGLYDGRIVAAEGMQEYIGDSDGYVSKQAVGYGKDPYASMQYFETTLGTWQRGWAFMSCDSDTCAAGVSFYYPTPPDYFPIEGVIDAFWIDAAWQGTTGDIFSSTNEFTVNPR
ncbi:MAG: hypothetical protein HJJLKODD_00064 [Phycisphaerae bacterium]|nr:hypothetical protein [Phycisphaerae bacterium]